MSFGAQYQHRGVTKVEAMSGGRSKRILFGLQSILCLPESSDHPRA